MAVFWHRRDLRPADNVGLAAAAADTPAVPVFVFDDAVLAHASPNRVAFLLDALDALREAYRERGGDLLVRRGDPSEELPAVAATHDADAVHWNDDHSGLARERDAAVRGSLHEAGVETRVHDDLLLVPPGDVLTNAGTPYQVFAPFYRTWREQPVDAPVPAPDRLAGADDESLPTLDALGFEMPAAERLDAGHAAGRARLEAFCDGPIYDYADDRDYPARAGTSRLSAHLTFGTVGIRTVWAATEAAHETAPDADAADSVREYQRQLAWREFYVDKLAAEPAMVAENHVDFERPIAWRNDPEELAAWRAGETGFPFVDAGMRQLRAEGWLPNRLRMVTASFLTKDLLVDWRRGYAHFRRHLVDHDPAADAGGWQWAASTGFDAQPYFRVFNPTTQGERFDPDAGYIRAHVPELAEADPEQIHAWPDLEPARREDAAPGYPAPIVDHAERRERAIAAFERARGD
ncbi:MAG: deoxyribodipyrimidine photo-lyase [Halobacteriales archaeon]